MKVEPVEVALRRLDDVIYVGVRDLGTSYVVQVLATPSADVDAVRREADRVCQASLGRPFVLELGGSRRPSRIRLLQVESRADGGVVVHLGYDGVLKSGRGAGTDPVAGAEATFDALRELGACVPFRLEAAAVFEHPIGEGVMVLLGSDAAGTRYGVASGPDLALAAARATLHALNRYLATQPLAPPARTGGARTAH